jgi:hypothetical protein
MEKDVDRVLRCFKLLRETWSFDKLLTTLFQLQKLYSVEWDGKIIRSDEQGLGDKRLWPLYGGIPTFAWRDWVNREKSGSGLPVLRPQFEPGLTLILSENSNQCNTNLGIFSCSLMTEALRSSETSVNITRLHSNTSKKTVIFSSLVGLWVSLFN